MALSITHIVNKIAAPFFYGNKFPTIRENVCQQQWGSHGHGQTQQTSNSWFWTCGIHRSGLRCTR
ncbi:hypothetical protein FFB58_06995 [Enterobacter sp. MF024]|nr:hypothetical protein FFB58_06995 [Enterobacter sp. MF024]